MQCSSGKWFASSIIARGSLGLFVVGVLLLAMIAYAAVNPEDAKPTPKPSVAKATFSVNVNRPAGSPVIDSGQQDGQGRMITVACGTCHQARPANPANRASGDLDEFHQGLVIKHGQLACVACHHPGRGYDSLRLADDSAISFPDVMQLCAQCHGPQYRDYLHGSHGGMTGHWDLTKGPRRRNNCIDCHDPHAPAYPQVLPARGPNDRFLNRSEEGKGHE